MFVKEIRHKSGGRKEGLGGLALRKRKRAVAGATATVSADENVKALGAAGAGGPVGALDLL